ncbi:hypothetical protein MMC24_007179 [Lignoscripta atroalba]|nr:hypothetical protein [Lignoscripta atroalba]
MAPKGGMYAGGYNEVTASKMATVELPEKIRCQACKKVKGVPQYSKKQLSDLRFKILQFGKISGTNGAYIKCRGCTGQQVTEMTCVHCDEVKGLDGFTKAQRREPDNARCISCVRDHMAVEPGLEGEGKDDESDGTSNPYPSDQDDDDEQGGAEVRGPKSREAVDLGTGTNTSENLRPSASRAGSSVAEHTDSGTNAWAAWATEAERQSEGAGGNVWVTQSRRSLKAPIAFTAYDSRGIAHSRLRAPSTSASEQSYTPTSSRSNFPRVESSSSRFPRVAPIAQPQPPPRRQAKGYTVAAESDDDDEDDVYYTL